MQKCPNCGQETERTEDWACKWCGYPLLSESYKKIPQTYKQLKEEKLHKQEPSVEEEPDPPPEPEPKPKAKPEPAPEPEPEPPPEPKPAPEPEPEPPPEPKPVPEPEPEPPPEPKPVPEPESMPAATEITVEELLSAYEADGAAADAKLVNKVLKITGVVNRIEVKENLDIYYITLTSAERNLSLQDVRCMFDRKHMSELNQLVKGQTVTVQGEYDGSIINFRMKDCFLVR